MSLQTARTVGVPWLFWEVVPLSLLSPSLHPPCPCCSTLHSMRKDTSHLRSNVSTTSFYSISRVRNGRTCPRNCIQKADFPAVSWRKHHDEEKVKNLPCESWKCQKLWWRLCKKDLASKTVFPKLDERSRTWATASHFRESWWWVEHGDGKFSPFGSASLDAASYQLLLHR